MNNKNKQRLIILSDLWGKEKSDWIMHYTSILKDYFNIEYYDSCDLGGVDKSIYTQKNLHQQFLAEGIEKAVENILKEETENAIVLGFSIGGLIAWKAQNAGLKAQSLFAISSTRLRYETQKSAGIIHLFYGEEDIYKPDRNWFNNMKIKERICKNEKHELYIKKEVAVDICKLIIAT